MRSPTASHAYAKNLTLRKEMVMMMMKRKMKTGTGMMKWEDSQSATVLLVDAIHRYVEGYFVSIKGA